MIQVVKIRGETYNLETGQQIPKALILSNGYRELEVPVSEGLIGEILQMMVEESERGPIKQPAPSANSYPKARTGPRETEPVPPPMFEEAFGGQEPAAVDPEYMTPPVSAAEDLEPGEEYEDALTGTSSL